jgi:chitin disaccharide deacetylase
LERVLIVNADDFGQSAAISRGIRRAHRLGIVTSASLMVRGSDAAHAAEHSDALDLGLHIDLGEWFYCDGAWNSRYERVQLHDASAVEAEIRFQLEEFCRLTGRAPTHLDSHQHVHLHEPVRSIAKQIADDLDVPLRGCSSAIRYCGEFYGQTGKGEPCRDAISVDALVKLVQDLPTGVTELACHPGDAALEHPSDYHCERGLEVDSLCHPRVSDAIRDSGVRLCSFAELASDCYLIEQPASN